MKRWPLLAALVASLVAIMAIISISPASARHHRHGVDAPGPVTPGSGEAGACRDGLSGGTPQVELRHIFCGEINRRSLAVGFHSRPNGVNPASVSGTGEPRPIRAYPGLYNLTRFQITQDGQTETKGISTFYPDKCSAGDVIAAIQYAYTHGRRGGAKFSGLSGPSCTDDNGKPFPITGFSGGRGGERIRTGYPDIRGER